VDADAAKVRAFHGNLAGAGVYGTRAELFVGDPFTFPFPPYLASLIVSETGFPNKEAADKLREVLHPYGGTLLVEEGNQAGVVKRDGPLAGSASWTHECADAARSLFSKDQLAKAPLGILWYGQEGENEFWTNNDYGIGVKPQVVGAACSPTRCRCARSSPTTPTRAAPVEGQRRGIHPLRRPARRHLRGRERCLHRARPRHGRREAKFAFKAEDEKGRKPLVSDIRVGDDVIVIAYAFEKVRVIEKGCGTARPSSPSTARAARPSGRAGEAPLQPQRPGHRRRRGLRH